MLKASKEGTPEAVKEIAIWAQRPETLLPLVKHIKYAEEIEVHTHAMVFVKSKMKKHLSKLKGNEQRYIVDRLWEMVMDPSYPMKIREIATGCFKEIAEEEYEMRKENREGSFTRNINPNEFTKNAKILISNHKNFENRLIGYTLVKNVIEGNAIYMATNPDYLMNILKEGMTKEIEIKELVVEGYATLLDAILLEKIKGNQIINMVPQIMLEYTNIAEYAQQQQQQQQSNNMNEEEEFPDELLGAIGRVLKNVVKMKIQEYGNYIEVVMKNALEIIHKPNMKTEILLNTMSILENYVVYQAENVENKYILNIIEVYLRLSQMYDPYKTIGHHIREQMEQMITLGMDPKKYYRDLDKMAYGHIHCKTEDLTKAGITLLAHLMKNESYGSYILRDINRHIKTMLDHINDDLMPPSLKKFMIEAIAESLTLAIKTKNNVLEHQLNQIEDYNEVTITFNEAKNINLHGQSNEVIHLFLDRLCSYYMGQDDDLFKKILKCMANLIRYLGKDIIQMAVIEPIHEKLLHIYEMAFCCQSLILDCLGELSIVVGKPYENLAGQVMEKIQKILWQNRSERTLTFNRIRISSLRCAAKLCLGTPGAVVDHIPQLMDLILSLFNKRHLLLGPAFEFWGAMATSNTHIFLPYLNTCLSKLFTFLKLDDEDISTRKRMQYAGTLSYVEETVAALKCMQDIVHYCNEQVTSDQIREFFTVINTFKKVPLEDIQYEIMSTKWILFQMRLQLNSTNTRKRRQEDQSSLFTKRRRIGDSYHVLPKEHVAIPLVMESFEDSDIHIIGDELFLQFIYVLCCETQRINLARFAFHCLTDMVRLDFFPINFVVKFTDSIQKAIVKMMEFLINRGFDGKNDLMKRMPNPKSWEEILYMCDVFVRFMDESLTNERSKGEWLPFFETNRHLFIAFFSDIVTLHTCSPYVTDPSRRSFLSTLDPYVKSISQFLSKSIISSSQ